MMAELQRELQFPIQVSFLEVAGGTMGGMSAADKSSLDYYGFMICVIWSRTMPTAMAK
jgi:hypothetical protein